MSSRRNLLCTDSSIFLDVITGRELPEATVLITSRPWASEFLRRECKRHISQHIEILGFTKDNIQFYLESTIPNDPSLLADLKKYISCYPHINSLMYIPLNSAIVVEVYRNSRKDKSLVPKTMTELYSSLVCSLLLRHLLDHPVHGKKRRWRVRTFSDLPQDVYQQLCELGRIAYEGILHDQQVIFSDLPEEFEILGLIQCTPELYADEGTAVSYNFLHLTVQEYLAAFHLSQQPVEKQIEHFKEYKKLLKYRKQHFHMVLKFLCGVRKFNGYPSEVLKTVCVEISKENWASYDDDYESSDESVVESGSESNDDSESGDDSDNVVCEVTFDALHWLFETQDNDVIARVLGSFIKLPDPSELVTLFDCFVLGYCVSHSKCAWKINLKSHYIGNEGVEMLVQGTVEETIHCMGWLYEIKCDLDSISSEGVKHLLSLPKKVINKLKILHICFNKLDSESCAVLADLIPHMPHLRILNLSNNYSIGQGGTVPLITSLTTHNSLKKLLLKCTRIDVEDYRALSELLSSSTSLKKLDIGGNHFTPEAVELITSGLHHNTTLKRLDMSYSSFSVYRSTEIATSLASMLRTNYTLNYLDLRGNFISEEGTQKLVDSLTHNYSVHLYLSGDCKSFTESSGFRVGFRVSFTPWS